jgi:hypothetical protein
MKHAYPWAQPLLAALFSFIVLSANAQQAWRPFRPGLIYTYEVPGSTSTGPYTTVGIYTLRLDSAYMTATGDSVWAFNRVLRETTGQVPAEGLYGRFRKSRNNLFGQRLRWQPGSTEYTLETVTEGTAQMATSLLLRPQAAINSTWVANAALNINATLSSRGLQTVNGQSDMVATITLSTGPVIRLSQNYGLIEGPQWLTLNGSPRQWVATQLPATVAQSPYSPLRLFDLQPGDEIGYQAFPIVITPFECSQVRSLRRFSARSQVGDSLIYTFQEQTRTENLSVGAPGCSTTPGTYYSGIATRRWAFSLSTGKSRQFTDTPMLTGEYRMSSGGGVFLSRGIAQLQPGGSGCTGNQQLVYDQLFTYGANDNTFGRLPDIDPLICFSPSLGLGDVRNRSTIITYYRRTRNGTTSSCGSPSSFATLLPTRAAQAAALATLHPNPATEAATLTLATPARPGTALRLTDALGRAVWRAPVPAGQLAVAVPLAGQPAGLYLLHLIDLSGANATWKLTHQ